MDIPNCSVGLYVGGMKQSDLDISATKRIIIATYDMAEEAFDCKTLNTLIFGTPHKNIKQAVLCCDINTVIFNRQVKGVSFF